jgi:acyl carrier protein
MLEVTPVAIADGLEAFVRNQFKVNSNDSGFTREADLFDRGYVDSVGIAELLEYLRQAFDVEIREEDLFSEEFSSINGIARIVSRTRAP